MNIKDMILAKKDEIIGLRRDFHMHPELGFAEYQTAGIVFDYLNKLNIETQYMARTGVVGLLKGEKEGNTLLLRADLDALPINEANKLPYKSLYEGVMHACGHDGHIAMLLVAANILADYKHELNGSIKFVFQPNEEDAGAFLMIEEGVMNNPVVDAAVGAHLWSGLKTGKIDICEGPVMAASHYFFLTIRGLGGHAGHINEAVDPIMVGTAIIQAVQAMQTRELDVLKPVSVIFTKFHSGINTTIVPETAEMQGSIRFLSNDGTSVKKAFERVISGVCAAHRAEYELSFKVGNEMVTNDAKMTEIAYQAATSCLDSEKDITNALQSMGGEDFSEYIKDIPGVFYFVGSGNRRKNTDYSHHHPCFDIDEDALLIGTEMYVKVALKYFNLL